MKLLLTPSIRLSESQISFLRETNELFFLEDERIPLEQQSLSFDPECIEGIVCNFFFLHNPVSALPRLRLVQLTSAGLDRVPVNELREKGIVLYNAGAVYAVPIAEWCVGKILEIYKHTSFFYSNQRECRWEKDRKLRELSGARAAIVGFGNIGRRIACRLRAFGVTIRAVDIVDNADGEADEWFHVNDLCRAVSDADIVILTLPLTESTAHIIDADVLSAMKDDAVLVNVARGGLIDEEALIRQLNDGRFYGVALDVFEKEPLDEGSPLWKMDRVLLSPHNCFVGSGVSERFFALLCKNLGDYQTNSSGRKE